MISLLVPLPQDTKEEDGAGDGKQTESEMVAKDDNKKGSEAGEQKEEQKEETEEKEQQPHELQQDEVWNYLWIAYVY